MFIVALKVTVKVTVKVIVFTQCSIRGRKSDQMKIHEVNCNFLSLIGVFHLLRTADIVLFRRRITPAIQALYDNFAFKHFM